MDEIRDKEIINENLLKINKGMGDIPILIYDTLKRKYLSKQIITFEEIQIFKKNGIKKFKEGRDDFLKFLEQEEEKKNKKI